MNFKLRVFLILAMTLYFGCIYHLLKKKQFQLKYSLLWIFGGVIIFLCIIFPNQFNFLMLQLGVAEAMNALFGICIFFILLFLMNVTSIISIMDIKNKQLAQKTALLEKRIRELEKSIVRDDFDKD